MAKYEFIKKVGSFKIGEIVDGTEINNKWGTGINFSNRDGSKAFAQLTSSEPNYPPTVKKIEEKKAEDTTSDSDKIMGMNKKLFYGLVGITVLVGGYFIYKKFKK
ncbi:MAG: hypothetical protein WCI04_00210 [archaeon]